MGSLPHQNKYIDEMLIEFDQRFPAIDESLKRQMKLCMLSHFFDGKTALGGIEVYMRGIDEE